MRYHRDKSKRTATTMVEFALVLTILILLTAGVIVMGLGVFRYQQIATMAREAARYASVHGTRYASENGKAAATKEDIYNNAMLPISAGLDLTVLTYDVTWNTSNAPNRVDPNSNPPGMPVANTVIVTIDYQWIPEGLFGGITLSTRAEMPMAY